MIYYLKGILSYKSPTFVVVEAGGIGYRVNISCSSFANLPSENERVKLYTYPCFKEENISLYGFLTEEERDFFLMLISVSSIGPKSALRILSRISVKDFKKAVREANLSSLINIPGIGEKTAQRLILELKEKIGGEVKGMKEKLIEDAVSGLVSLGYTRGESRKAINEVLSTFNEKEFDLARLIKEALRYI